MGLATLGGLPLSIDPTSVSWNFRMKIAEHATVGGKVIQVFGTELGDMTISGTFGGGQKAKGDTAGWEAQERFRAQVEAWATADASSLHPTPLRFLYPSKKWDFKVHVKAFGGQGGGSIVHANDVFNPAWQLTLFIVEDSTQKVVTGIKDMYLSRLMNGVGWKQSEYNGPTQKSVDDLLAPYHGSANDYLHDQFVQAASGQSANTNGAMGGTP